MKKIIPVMIIMSIGIFSFADWVDHPIGFDVWIPEKWHQESDNDLFYVKSSDAAAAVRYFIVDATNLDASVAKLETELLTIMTKPMITREKEKVVVHGIPGIITGGTGYLSCTLMDVKISWLAGILQYRKKALMVVGFAADASYYEHEAEIREMLSSIRNLWFQHPIGIDVWIPPEWTVKTEKNSLLVSSPDGEVKIKYQIINAQKLTQALNMTQGDLKKDLSGVHIVKEAQEFTVSGLSGVITSGTGSLKGSLAAGGAVKWMVTIVVYKNKALSITAIAKEQSFTKYEPEIGKMLRSLKTID